MSLVIYVLCMFLAILLAYALVTIKYARARGVEEWVKSCKDEELCRKNLVFFIPKVESAKSLRELYTLHIQIWANGLRHKNFGPDQYGIFRTQDILKMTPDEVFLGNTCGLFTHPMPFWENTADEDSRQIVTSQYRHVLLSNLKCLYEKT